MKVVRGFVPLAVAGAIGLAGCLVHAGGVGATEPTMAGGLPVTPPVLYNPGAWLGSV